MLAVETRLPWRSPWRVWLTDPEDTTETGTDRLQTATAGATAACKVYPEHLRRRLRGAASAAGLVIQVPGAGDFKAGGEIEITAAAGTRSIRTIDSIDEAAGTLTLTAGLEADVARGGLVRGYFGSWPLSEFGTPAVDSKLWGWQATTPDDLDVEPGERVMIEIELTAVGGGVTVFPQLGLVDDGR